MRLGVHVSIAGGLPEALTRAKRLGCTAMQIFSRSPRGGAAPKLAAETVAQFDAERRRADIEPLAVHAPYIINLASPAVSMWQFAARLFREEYARCAQIGARYLVAHVGSHRGSGETKGIARVAEALSRTLTGLRSDVMILLECTAGAGQGLGEKFEQLAEMRDATDGKERVGVCLDTAHLFAAGYPIHTAEGLEETVQAADRILGLRQVRLIHLNDSKAPFGSHVDRHWHIGKGQIGAEALGRIVTHPKLRDLPFILETPKETEAEDRRNLNAVRALAGSHGRSRRRVAA